MSISQSVSTPQLADHVRACLVGDQLIFLDLLRSKYISVGGHQLHALSAALLGETPTPPAQTSPTDSALLGGRLQRLHAHQLLAGPFVPRRQIRTTLAEPVISLDTQDDVVTGSEWRRLVRLWQSTFVTSRWLRQRSLADIASRVVALRARLSSHQGDADGMRAAVAAYLRLRPFALTSHDRCLNDSLALVYFLAYQGLFPQWVIGVRTHPFRAHSWVQSGDIVLNDVPERVRAYRPILVV